jgi:ParB family chromosome partitioning protein
MQKNKPILKQLAIDQLIKGAYQPRQYFDQEKLKELTASIKTTQGLLQPIIVRQLRQGQYEIIAGERRWLAAQAAGLTEIDCLVLSFTDEQALQASIIENVNRADLNPIEEAKAYQRLIDEFQYLHEEIAESVGKSRAAVTNSLRLLKLAPSVQTLLISGQLSEGHGKILAGLSHTQQIHLAKRCIQHAWNVRKIESEAKKIQQPPPATDSLYSDVNHKHLEVSLSEHLGNRVQIEYENAGGGYMHIRFNNIDELQGHFDRIRFQYNNLTNNLEPEE